MSDRLAIDVCHTAKLTSSSGIVIEDPAVIFPIGTTLSFQSVRLIYTPPRPAVAISNWESFHGVLLAIVFSESTIDRIEGSAVLVAPGIALCAWHVIEPYMPSIIASQQQISCFGIDPSGLILWRIKKITQVPDTDFAILGLERGSTIQTNETLHHAHITTRFPKVGERVTLFGFRASKPQFERLHNETIKLAGALLSCAGEVVQNYPCRRDRVMLPWPVIEVACPSWGGMSGGPVVDESGRVIGLLSTSFTTDDHDGPSYVSHLFPALTTSFEGGWPATLFEGPSTLLKIDANLCAIDGREAFTYSIDPDTGRVKAIYKFWDGILPTGSRDL